MMFISKRSFSPSQLVINITLLSWAALFHYSLGYGIKPLYAVVVYFAMRLLSSCCRPLFRITLLLLSLLAAGYMPVGAIYGSPDVNVVGSVMYTHKAESLEYLVGLPTKVWVLSGLILLLCGGLIVCSKSLVLSTRKKRNFVIAFCVIATLWSPVRKGELLQGVIPMPFYRFVGDLLRAYREASIEKDAWASIINQKSKWNPTALEGKRDLYVMVIGESVRLDYLHAFGYHRYPEGYTNTPWLDNAPVKMYTSYLSAGASTVPSLTNTLVAKDGRTRELNNSIVTLAKSAGLETWWISNQGQKGRFDSPVALIGSRADHVVFFKSADSDDRSSASDDLLLPVFEDALMSNSSKPKLIVLHLMGSHPVACIRTKGAIDIDMGAKEISCYVKSIAQTDTLLSHIESSLKQYNGQWSLMYFADHGLSYVDKDTSDAYLTHSDKTRENYEVPFFIMNSEDTQQHIDDTRYSALDFLSTFANWIRVSDDSIPCSHLHDGKVLDYDGELIDLNTLPSVH